MGFDLSDRFETTDGSRPDPRALDDDLARRLPLSAFAILRGGDAFEAAARAPPVDGPLHARRTIDRQVRIERHGNDPHLVTVVVEQLVRQLSGNQTLCARLERAHPILVEIIPAGRALVDFGYPAHVNERASGLFWDHPSWPHARIALRAEALAQERILVVHEMAHALHSLAFTKAERALIYDVLRPTFHGRAAMDEVFAIYSEREFLDTFSTHEKRAPGVYGFARRQWHEDHLFTRFVRKLYFPHQPLAGPKLGSGRTGWKRFLG